MIVMVIAYVSNKNKAHKNNFDQVKKISHIIVSELQIISIYVAKRVILSLHPACKCAIVAKHTINENMA